MGLKRTPTMRTDPMLAQSPTQSDPIDFVHEGNPGLFCTWIRQHVSHSISSLLGLLFTGVAGLEAHSVSISKWADALYLPIPAQAREAERRYTEALDNHFGSSEATLKAFDAASNGGMDEAEWARADYAAGCVALAGITAQLQRVAVYISTSKK